MISRYDFMRESAIKDEVTGNFYPDPLSLNYLEYDPNPNSLPESIILRDEDITLFWYLMSRYYGSSELDDIVLTLNGVSHINFLKYGDVIRIPSREDIQNSFRRQSNV